jgi:CBS domain-containing protein
MESNNLRFNRPAPKIKQVMTPFPFFVLSSATVGDAMTMMDSHQIHHLPVQENGDLIGIVSSRDLEAAEDRTSSISLVMKPDVLLVDMEQPLDGVLEVMMRERLGSALVRHGDKLAGIFTTFDACRLLVEAFGSTGEPASDSVA